MTVQGSDILCLRFFLLALALQVAQDPEGRERRQDAIESDGQPDAKQREAQEPFGQFFFSNELNVGTCRGSDVFRGALTTRWEQYQQLE